MKFVEVCYNENGDSMTLFMYLLMTCIIVCLVFIWYINTYNKFQSYIIRMNEAEANIDTILRKRFDLLNKSISIIKANAEIEEDI
ncbi:MAG: LemA family protein, partial [Bacilli bacterium]|nr:LemA family protein [Bacilli bacterium]